MTRMPDILRKRADESERGGHHSVEWCNGVRFAANQIEGNDAYQCELIRALTAKLDALADAAATHLCVDIGEHSPDNDPWQNATDALRTAEPHR